MTTQQANERAVLERISPGVLKSVARAPVAPHLVKIGSEPFEKPSRLWCRPEVDLPIKRWPSLSAALKRSVDVLGAALLSVIFAPLIVAIIGLMSREQGPILFRHRRIGRDGRLFECYKFRTMVPNADSTLRKLFELQPELKAEWISNHKLRNDPRVTAVGRFLRRTSLDELPQLLNVLRGEMSLVGPRPIVREELIRYGRGSVSYLAVKPGITGLWQVKGRNDTDYRRRVAIDVYYVRNQSLVLDLYILLKTTQVVLAGNGAY